MLRTSHLRQSEDCEAAWANPPSVNFAARRFLGLGFCRVFKHPIHFGCGTQDSYLGKVHLPPTENFENKMMCLSISDPFQIKSDIH